MADQQGAKTPLYAAHLAAEAKMVDFHGWQMPLHYGSQLEEHHVVRRACGMFDVSHMTVVDVTGAQAQQFLQRLLMGNVAKLENQGKALYTAMLNEQGGVIDDLITYFFSDTDYRLVVNSATREKDLNWIKQIASEFDVSIVHRDDLAMVAVQGPEAPAILQKVLSGELALAFAEMKPFNSLRQGDWHVATTGYTGERGAEVILPATEAEDFWKKLLDAGAAPCGLGARDTLRLEAGMNLYGQDMDESVTPLAANMGWAVDWEPEQRDFVGRDALVAQKADGHDKLVGLVLRERGVLRPGQTVVFSKEDGSEGRGLITSGSFSPTLGLSIAFARVEPGIGEQADVEIRKKRLPVEVRRPVFVRAGKALVETN